MKNREKKGGSIFCCGPQCAVASIWLCLSRTQLRAQTLVDMFKVGTPCPALTTTLYSSAVKVQFKTVHSYSHLLKCFPFMVRRCVQVYPRRSINCS